MSADDPRAEAGARRVRRLLSRALVVVGGVLTGTALSWALSTATGAAQPAAASGNGPDGIATSGTPTSGVVRGVPAPALASAPPASAPPGSEASGFGASAAEAGGNGSAGGTDADSTASPAVSGSAADPSGAADQLGRPVADDTEPAADLDGGLDSLAQALANATPPAAHQPIGGAMTRPVIDPIRQSPPAMSHGADESASAGWLGTLDQLMRSLGQDDERFPGYPPFPIAGTDRPAVPAVPAGWHIEQWRVDQWSTAQPAVAAPKAAETGEAPPAAVQPDAANQTRSDQAASPANPGRSGSAAVRSTRRHQADGTPATGSSRHPVPTRPDTPPANTPAAPCSCGLAGAGAAGNPLVGVSFQAADTPGIAVGRALTRRTAPALVLPGRQPGITPD